MPTYDYLCKTCGHRFEHFQSITSDALTHCPEAECIREGAEKGTGEVVRLVSGGAGLVFKGEGFYLTDYVRKGGGEGGSGSSSKASPSKGSAAGDTSSKTSPAASGASSGDSGSSSGSGGSGDAGASSGGGSSTGGAAASE